MWLLAVRDRQYWLLPGKQYTVGRSTNNAGGSVDIVIQESSISRSHLTLEVHDATEDAMFHPSIKSVAYITDLGSRFGTAMDGQPLEAGHRTQVPLKASKSVLLKIGSFAVAKLRWKNYIVTYSTGQAGDAHEALWNYAVETLKPLNVKLLPHLVKDTNVLVKSGAATSTVFFALAANIPVVNSKFMEALREAATESSRKGTRGPVIPDFTPFIPDPAWKPDSRRKTCLAGQTFCFVDEQHGPAFGPIIEAAGGLCVSDPDSLRSIWISQTASETEKVPEGAQYTDLASVFSAISEVHAVKPTENRKPPAAALKRSGSSAHMALPSPDATSAPKRQKPLPSTKAAEPTDASSSTVPSRSRRAKVNFFNVLTSSQPTPPQEKVAALPNMSNDLLVISANDDSTKRLASNCRLDVDRPRDTAEPSSAVVSLTDAIPEEPTPVASNGTHDESLKQKSSSIVSRKRASDSRSTVARKKARAMPSPPEVSGLDINTTANDESDDVPAIVDYTVIGELAIVEASMTAVREARPMAHSPQPNGHRPNFKRFHKNGSIIPSHLRPGRRVDYDVNIQDDRSLDDEFAATAPAAAATVPISSTLLSALRAGTPSGQRRNGQDEEESLFVSSNAEFDVEDESMVADRSGRSITRSFTADVSAEDDGFSFKFS